MENKPVIRQIVMELEMQDPSLESLSALLTTVRSIDGVNGALIVPSEGNKFAAVAPTFERELESLINKHSQENGSNTPDFVLASYLKNCLDNWNLHTRERDRWYGNRSILGPGNEMPVVDAGVESLLKKSATSPSVDGEPVTTGRPYRGTW